MQLQFDSKNFQIYLLYFLLLFLNYCLRFGVLPAFIAVQHLCVWYPRRSETVSDPLEQTVVGCWESNQGSPERTASALDCQVPECKIFNSIIVKRKKKVRVCHITM